MSQSAKTGLAVGDRLSLAHFGAAEVRKLYQHRESREHVVDVVTHAGQSLHISERYAKLRKTTNNH